MNPYTDYCWDCGSRNLSITRSENSRVVVITCSDCHEWWEDVPEEHEVD